VIDSESTSLADDVSSDPQRDLEVTGEAMNIDDAVRMTIRELPIDFRRAVSWASTRTTRTFWKRPGRLDSRCSRRTVQSGGPPRKGGDLSGAELDQVGTRDSRWRELSDQRCVECVRFIVRYRP
jgi:hypothetical protein